MPKALPRPISEEDLELALKAAHVIDLGIYAMLRLMCDAGLRCMEVAAISRVDLRDQDKPLVLVIREGKGGRQRIVPVGQSVRLAIIGTGVRHGHLFRAASPSGHVTAHFISRAVNSHLRRMGIPDTAHSLRHRYLTVGYQRTRDLRMCQELAGHSSPVTTARYAAYSPANAGDLIEHLDELAGV